jgi:hypothetical protein
MIDKKIKIIIYADAFSQKVKIINYIKIKEE